MGFFKQGSLIERVVNNVTSGGTTTLTATSHQNQVFTGSAGQTVILPDATTLPNGRTFYITNRSTAQIIVYFNDAVTIAKTITPNTEHLFLLTNNSTTNGVWDISTGSGSGAGAGGVNFAILDSNYQPSKTDNWNFENSLGDWATYANTVAGATPDAGMTGGTPSGNVTLTRTTTGGQVIDGLASALITKGAFNVQGEGFSLLFPIPPAFRTSRCSVSIPFKILSGSLVQGDIKVFLYDVTNGSLIVPLNNDLVGSQGVLNASFEPSLSTAQLRVGFHFASTSATAVTIAFDDVVVSPVQPVNGLAGSDWRSDLAFSPSAGFGTVTNAFYAARRVGDSLQASLVWTNGTTAGSTAYVQLPPGMAVDASKISSQTNFTQVGVWIRKASVGATNISSNDLWGPVFYDGSTPNQLFLALKTNGSAFQKDNVNTIFSTSGDSVSIEFTVPIAGWSAILSMASSASFSIASVVANGTRVTGVQPSVLGQWRSQLRNASATTFTDTNGSPSTSPNANDGMKFWAGNGFASADTNNQPSRYDIFVGKNKNIKFVFFAATGKSDPVDPSVYVQAADATIYGTYHFYDPTTGVATIMHGTDGVDTTAFIGRTNSFGNPSNGYFDIIVSENALGVGLDKGITVVCSNNAGSMTAASAITSGWTKLRDTHGAFDTSTGLFTVPANGQGDYHVDWEFISSSSINFGQIYKNGVLFLYGSNSSGSRGGAHAVVPNCVPGDTIFVTGDQNATISAFNNQSILSIFRCP